MKRLLIIVSLITVSIVSFAQDGLKGKWTLKHSFMGVTGTELMEFNDNNSGKVSTVMTIDFSMGMLGVKVIGAAKASASGTFTFDGKKIVIDWDENTAKLDVTKPVTAYYRGEVVESSELGNEFKQMFNEMTDDMVKEMSEGDEFTDVQIKGDKLILKSKGEDGKLETEKYTRVK